MRQLRIVVQKAGGALPIVVAASVASLEACGQSTNPGPGTGAASGMPASGGGQGGRVAAGS
jgi:hypothetical protein